MPERAIRIVGHQDCCLTQIQFLILTLKLIGAKFLRLDLRFGSRVAAEIADAARMMKLFLAALRHHAGVPTMWSRRMALAARPKQDHTEGPIAKTIEDQTAKLPSDTFLWAAVGAMALSATLHLAGNKHASVFVGQWAPTILILGLYNKLVKQLGSDYTDSRSRV